MSSHIEGFRNISLSIGPGGTNCSVKTSAIEYDLSAIDFSSSTRFIDP
jgi:hypothetical protein